MSERVGRFVRFRVCLAGENLLAFWVRKVEGRRTERGVSANVVAQTRMGNGAVACSGVDGACEF